MIECREVSDSPASWPLLPLRDGLGFASALGIVVPHSPSVTKGERGTSMWGEDRAFVAALKMAFTWKSLEKVPRGRREFLE